MNGVSCPKIYYYSLKTNIDFAIMHICGDQRHLSLLPLKWLVSFLLMIVSILSLFYKARATLQHKTEVSIQAGTPYDRILAMPP